MSMESRSKKILIEYKPSDHKPLHVLNKKGEFMEHFYACSNVCKLFNFNPGFQGQLKRTIYCKDEW